MKYLILACFLGIAAASFLQEAAPAVDSSVLWFLRGATKAGSLSDTLGVHEKWLDDSGDDIQTDLGKALKEALNDMLEKIKEHVDHGKDVGKEMLEKVKELRDKLKEVGVDAGDKAREIFEKIKEKAKETLKKLLEKIGLGKRNLDDQMDVVARMKFGDLVERIREKILSSETIQKIRDYIKKLSADSPIVKQLKEFVQKLRNVDLREIISHLLEYKPGNRQSRAMSETWDKIKEFFKDLHVKIQEHSKKFGEWVKDMWGKGLDKLKDRYGTIKAIAMEFIAHAKDTSAEVAREALEFFRPYKEDLGSLWDQIVDASKEAIGKF